MRVQKKTKLLPIKLKTVYTTVRSRMRWTHSCLKRARPFQTTFLLTKRCIIERVSPHDSTTANWLTAQHSRTTLLLGGMGTSLHDRNFTT